MRLPINVIDKVDNMDSEIYILVSPHREGWGHRLAEGLLDPACWGANGALHFRTFIYLVPAPPPSPNDPLHAPLYVRAPWSDWSQMAWCQFESNKYITNKQWINNLSCVFSNETWPPNKRLLVMMPNLHLPSETFIFYYSFPEDATLLHFTAFLFAVAY